MEKIMELRRQLIGIDIEKRNELLKLLAEAYFYNDELINDGVYNDLYTKLSAMYKPLTEDPETLKTVQLIRNGEKKENIDNMSLIVIEQIMIGLKGGIGLDVEHGIDKMLFDYHNKYNKEFMYDLYMNELSNSVGKKVFVVGKYDKEQPIMETGILERVDEYQGFRLNGEEYRFIGYKYYIKSISDENKKVLFNNPSDYNIERYVDPEEIAQETKRLFGDKYIQTAKKLG